MYKIFREYFSEIDLLTIESIMLPRNRWQMAGSIGTGALEVNYDTHRKADVSASKPELIPLTIRTSILEAVNEACAGDYHFMEQWGINRYKGEDKGHFYWHKDRLGFGLLAKDMHEGITPEQIFIKNTTPSREMSVSVALNDRCEYTGGQFIIDIGDGEQTSIDLDRGDMVVFDSDTFHGVNDVTEGERQALIIWLVHKEKFDEWEQIRYEGESTPSQ